MIDNDNWKEFSFFPSNVYFLEKPSFLQTIKNFCYKLLSEVDVDKINKLYPVIMSRSFQNDQMVENFVSYIGNTCYNILDHQGYDMDSHNTYISSMWTQQHMKYSLMEQHLHGGNIILSGFYFLDVPEDQSCKAIIYDPRHSKIVVDPPQKPDNNINYSSQQVVFDLHPGLIFITNSWIPHSFTRNGSDSPFTFVHFNVGIINKNTPIFV